MISITRKFEVIIDFLARLCRYFEFVYRVLLVNLPSFVLAKFPELDRISSIIMTYLLMQVVGFCWAILVNAAFAVSCRSSEYLPPFEVFTYVYSLVQTCLGYQELGINLNLPKDSSSSLSSVQLLLAFYISYASIRVFIGFAQSIFAIALQSIKDFPDASKLLASGGSLTLKFVPLVFIPSIILEIALLTSDLCASDDLSIIPYRLCRHSGLFYISSKYPHSRRIVMYSLIVMVMQLWQSALHQFPRWDQVFKRLTFANRFFYQISVFILSVMTLVIILVPKFHFIGGLSEDHFTILTASGWTIWLFTFYQQIIQVHGETWIKRVSTESIEHLAAFMRLSLMFMLGILFFRICIVDGYLQAQLDLTFMTIVLPTLYCYIYLITVVAMRAGMMLLLYSIPVALVLAIAIVQALSFLSNSTTSTVDTGLYGQGSIVLVFIHIFGKIIQIFGDEIPVDDDNYDDDISDADLHEVMSTISNRLGRSLSTDDMNFIDTLVHMPLSRSSARDTLLSDIDTNSDHPAVPALLTPSSMSRATSLRRISSNAEQLLAMRGHEHSTLVRLGIPKYVNAHWTVAASKRYLSYLGNITRSLIFTDSILSGVILIFIAIGAIITLILSFISIGSFAQNALRLFPRTMHFHISMDGSGFLFDHRIANVSLFTNHSNPHYKKIFRDQRQHLRNSESSNAADSMATCPSNISELMKPTYASCNWKSHGLTLLDYALMSELAYFDDDKQMSLRNITNILFPDFGFDVISSESRNYSVGPVYLEFYNAKTSTTVIAVRGTDVGRLHDFLEDVKLYAEPVIFTLLSTIFPTIRLWTHETMSTVIEWLYELNSFFGLQGEAEYYRPLLERVLELRETRPSHQIVITGHSLGGGLARIVGTLSETPSVSFSPPGLGLSYRKYRTKTKDGKLVKVNNKGSVHHQSVAVITELDW
jgi:hypothetical protein